MELVCLSYLHFEKKKCMQGMIHQSPPPKKILPWEEKATTATAAFFKIHPLMSSTNLWLCTAESWSSLHTLGLAPHPHLQCLCTGIPMLWQTPASPPPSPLQLHNMYTTSKPTTLALLFIYICSCFYMYAQNCGQQFGNRWDLFRRRSKLEEVGSVQMKIVNSRFLFRWKW